jgi:methylase of polypeptide subunit release factors
MQARRLESLARLHSLAANNEAVRDRQHAQAERFHAIEERKPWQARVVVSDNLFPTPEPLATRMVGMLELHAHARVLEPSCGTGRLLAALAATSLPLEVDALDIAQPLVDDCATRFTGWKVIRGDFLAYRTLERYDRIIMNPPFRRGSDIKHICHAAGMLARGGKLVSLCYNGAQQNAKLKPLCDSWEVLQPGTFKSEGTSADVSLLTITR